MLINTLHARSFDRPVHVLTAGAPPPETILQGAEALGFIVDHGYGLSETGGISVSCTWNPNWTKLPPSERAQLKSRQGVRTISTTELDVVDQITRKPVSRNGKMIGEIVLRGGTIMLGYLKNKEGTLKCLRNDGWFRTGDLGVMHSNGYIEIKDRSKDVIISGAENISSVEVKSVKPTAKEIIEYCRMKLPHYMAPKTVVFKDDLPKTSTGKIQKFVLKEIARVMGPSKHSRL